MLIFGLVFFTSLMMTSCGEKSDYDFSTPEASIKSLIKASAKKDKDALSLCFSKESKEFKEIVDKTISDGDLEELKQLFANATIKGVEEKDNLALVSIKLSSRDEEIQMKKENNNWVVFDF